jgi:predicted oxidoreductase (fatty acid repression mutant protein)
MDALLLEVGTTGERQVWFTRKEVVAAMQKQSDGYTERARQWRDYGEGMHQRAMRAEAELARLQNPTQTNPESIP